MVQFAYLQWLCSAFCVSSGRSPTFRKGQKTICLPLGYALQHPWRLGAPCCVGSLGRGCSAAQGRPAGETRSGPARPAACCRCSPTRHLKDGADCSLRQPAPRGGRHVAKRRHTAHGPAAQSGARSHGGAMPAWRPGGVGRVAAPFSLTEVRPPRPAPPGPATQAVPCKAVRRQGAPRWLSQPSRVGLVRDWRG